MADKNLDLFSGVDDVHAVRYIIADVHDDLSGRVSRFRMLADLCASLGRSGVLLSGGHAAYFSWAEARSSFVNGNFCATIFLCQSLVEHLLASHLRLSQLDMELPKRLDFRETLSRCVEAGLLNAEERDLLDRLRLIRNPLAHFRDIDDESALDRRSLQSRIHPLEIIKRDAEFAITTAIRILSKHEFSIG
jgi:HEPN domain-containing protein